MFTYSSKDCPYFITSFFLPNWNRNYFLADNQMIKSLNISLKVKCVTLQNCLDAFKKKDHYL